MHTPHKIELGMKVRDKITGLTGIVIARTEWLSGCLRLTIQPEAVKDSKQVDTQTIDEDQLEVVGSKHPLCKTPVEPVSARRGGGREQPTRQSSPPR